MREKYRTKLKLKRTKSRLSKRLQNIHDTGLLDWNKKKINQCKNIAYEMMLTLKLSNECHFKRFICQSLLN